MIMREILPVNILSLVHWINLRLVPDELCGLLILEPHYCDIE